MLTAASLSNIFLWGYFLASNELGNWHQILIKFITISQKQKQNPPKQKNKNHQPTEVVKPGCKLYYVQTGIRITEIVLTAWHLLKNCLYITPIFMKGKWICNFLLYRYERGSKKAKLRETDATRRAVVAFGCFGLCTSNSHTHRRSPVPAGLHGSPGSQHPNNGPDSSSSKCLFVPLQ